MSTTEAGARGAARLALVEEHVRLENRHDLYGIMDTFGASARYDEEPWDDHYIGPDAVRGYYDRLHRAMPDPAIDIRRRYVADAADNGAGDQAKDRGASLLGAAHRHVAIGRTADLEQRPPGRP